MSADDRFVDTHDSTGHRITLEAFTSGLPLITLTRAAHPDPAYRRDHPKSRHRH